MAAQDVIRDDAEDEDYYCQLIADWPPLTDAQRERLALLLNPGAGHAS
jgi:hypothetical protein